MKRVLAFACVALISLDSIASAQSAPQDTGKYDVRNGREQFANEFNTKILLDFEKNPAQAYTGAGAIARCIARNAKGKAGDLLGGPFTNDPSYSRLTRAITGKYRSCYPANAGGLPLFVLNAALAEEMVRPSAASLQERVVPSDPAAAKSFYSESAGLTMDGLGRCLAVYSPGLAYRVLAAPAGSQAETQAFAGLYSHTPECGVTGAPQGVPTIEQRTAIAAGLYHWTHRG